MAGVADNLGMLSPVDVLKSLPPDTPLSAAHVVAIVEALQGGAAPQEHTPSKWDREKLIDEQTLCDWLGESPDTVKKWRVKGNGPLFLKSAKNVRYQVGHVRDWLQGRTVASTSEASVKGLTRYLVEGNTAFPVFTYTDGLRLGLKASIAHEQSDPETTPIRFSIVSLGDDRNASDEVSVDQLKQAIPGGERVDVARWLYTQFLNGRLAGHLPFLQAVRILVARGADINAANELTGYTIAHVLALNQHGFTHEQYFNEFATELLDMGLNLQLEDTSSMSALDIATQLDPDPTSSPLLHIHNRWSFAQSLEAKLPAK